MANSLKPCTYTGTRTIVTQSLLVCLGALLSSAPAMAQQTINITTYAWHSVCGNGTGSNGNGDCGNGYDPYDFDPAMVTGNTVTIRGAAAGVVYGAYNVGDTGVDRKAEGNRVTIDSNGKTINSVTGGYASERSSGSGVATNNWVVFLGGTVHSTIMGGAAAGTNALSKVDGNRVEMSGGMAEYGVAGGYLRAGTNSQAVAENNHIELSGNAQATGFVVAGAQIEGAEGDASATGNTAVISGTAQVSTGAYGVFGSSYDNVLVTNNHLTISGSADVAGNAVGGLGFSMTAKSVVTLNTVTIAGGTASGGGFIDVGIAGGYANAPNGATATYNTVTISGGEIKSNIYGGYATHDGTVPATVTNNTVILAGAPNLTAASLFGGYIDANGADNADSDAFTGNTLQVKTTGLSVAGLSNFEFLTFYVPATATSGTTMLNVSGVADLSDGGSRSSTVGIFIEGSHSALQLGDQIILIDAASINGAPANTQTTAHGTQGATLQYDFELSVAANRLIATLTEASAREESKSLSEGYLSSAAMLGQGSSFLVQQGMEAAREAIQSTSEPASDATRSTAVQEPLSLHTFGTFSGGKLRYNTGSHVDVEGYNLIAGVANGFRLNAGKEAMLAGFFEYGKGDYTSHNSFVSGKVRGRGDTEYKGIGFIGRFDFDGVFYLEGSLRGGQAETNYRSSDLTSASGHGARYEAKNGYIGAHLGVGKTWKLGDKNTLDTYAQALWTRQGKDTVSLSTGDRVKFDEINSERLRVGARFSHAFLTNLSGYAGLAYDYEFAGKAKAEVNGHAVDAPSLKGGTGSLEVGVTSQPSANQPLYLSVGVQGHAGKREGATASFRINYFF